MTITVFRHTPCEDLGSLAKVLEKNGITYRYVDAFHDDISAFDPHEPDVMIFMGASAGVYQDSDYPFIKEEIDIIEKRLAEGLPTLGICFGAQLIARALGAKVYKGEQGPEKGWHPLSVNEQGKKTVVRHLDKEHTNMVQWHGDTFDLPKEATLLASSDNYPHQIFSYGDHTLALQCHPEVTPYILKNWYVSSAAAVAQGDIDIHKIRTETEKHIDILMGQSEKFFVEWLQQVKKENNIA